MGIFDKLIRKKDLSVSSGQEDKPKVKKDKIEADKKVKAVEAEKKIQEKSDVKTKKAEPQVVKSDKKVKLIKYKDAYKVLIKPVVSEKATYLSSQNSYVFEVAPNMNKVEIMKAIQYVYGVKPVKVNIINVVGRYVRYGRVTGRTKAWKKAIITLKPGESIQIYEGV